MKDSYLTMDGETVTKWTPIKQVMEQKRADAIRAKSRSSQWMVEDPNGEKKGPLSHDDLAQMVLDNPSMTPNTSVMNPKSESKEWVRMNKVPELEDIVKMMKPMWEVLMPPNIKIGPLSWVNFK